MEPLADRDPEDARRLLDTVLQHMMDAVHHYEGTVNQLMGDGVMVLFGAPLAHEDHAVRAAYAALRMQEAVTRYAEEVHRTLGVPLHIRVGLNSGKVVVRSISNDLRMDYTAIGQTTHLAARMEQLAMPGSILVTPDTLALVEGYVLIRALGPRPVKGLEAPIEVFEVVGASPIRSRLRAAAPSARVLLLVNYRPEYRHVWGSKSYYQQLRIDPLTATGAAALLDGLLGDSPSLESLKRLLVARTDGNPFFLEESLRTLTETGVIVGQRGAMQLVKAVAGIQIPATVQAVLAARIDRLPAPAKQLLQSAAVIGKDVALALLEAVVESPAAELRRELTQLQAAEFLYEGRLFPELEYTFRHALTLEVAYQSLLRERRRLLHARVLGALEDLRAEHVGKNMEVLAHHAVRGEVWPRAAIYLYRAGAKAQAEARYEMAGPFYAASLDALEHLGPDADRRLQLDAYLELWSTRISTGRIDGLSELGTKVEALARALGDGPRLAQVQVREAQAIAFAAAIPGTLQSAVDRAREAVMRAEESDLRTRSYAHLIAAVACRDLGRIDEAVAEFETGLGLFTDDGGRGHDPGLVYPIYVSLGAWGAEARAARGDFEAALRSAHDALHMAVEIKHPSSVSIADAFLGYVHLMRGDLDAAVPVLERGLAISTEHELVHGIGHRPEIAHCHATRGRLAARSGDAGQAAEHRAAARRVFDELTMAFWSGRA
jgi:class 3 adenylate cyclase/tetratricopeptide (TPR) repeat protein